LLSTGFPLTLLGIRRIGRMLRYDQEGDSWSRALKEYADITSLELETTADLVGALYTTMDRFELFKALSLLYFAAASFSEVSRRLGKAQLADSFLLCRDPEFGPQLKRLCAAARQARSAEDQERLKKAILEAIAPFDLAGLTDISRDPWYPARGEDILANAGKLGASPDELTRFLTSQE
jgi:tetracycline 7-halogenase / FADH2 O2-dependent halogenase